MKKCLIVDDSKTIRKIAGKIVEDLGLKVFEAENGEEALKVCEVEFPDVILLDWNMPIMDGLNFAKIFKSKYKDSPTNIIFCTTENEISKIQEALTVGADEYIMKPFDSEIIESKFIQLNIL